MLKIFSQLFLLLSSFFSSEPHKNIVLQLGDSKCTVNIHRRQGTNALIIALHGNENTCISAYSALPVSYPFALYELMQNDNRLLKYKYKGKNYYFDPNRIFSKVGIIKTLSKYNIQYPGVLVDKVKMFSNNLLKIIFFRSASECIIALHNNTNRGFSVKSYTSLSAKSMVNISTTEDLDDFFLVTQPSDFKFFKAQNQNVVLQGNSTIDDGSLSLFCLAKKIRYINIEAQNGHKQKQTKMLLLCARLLGNRSF